MFLRAFYSDWEYDHTKQKYIITYPILNMHMFVRV